MQYIQLQGQVAADLELPSQAGSYNLFIDTSDNSIKAKDSDGHMHGGGGLSLTELTRNEIGNLVASASLTPGAFYKITGAASQSFLDNNGFGWTGYGNEIQDGGTTIILQATTDKTLSTKGIGLFYVPNYASHSVWDNTHQLDFNNLSGMFDHEEYVQLYSANEGTSTDAYLVANAGNYSLTIVYDNNNDTFLSDSTNLIDLTITGYNTNASASITGYEYTSSYAEGNKVIWGGRVWENLNGNVGYKDGSWPNTQLTLNSADWTKVAFNETDYTIVADLIEYEFEVDNISYRKGANNVEVTSTWKVWDDNWGYNMIKYFPWGHPNVQDVSISNSYLDSFVNYPDSSTASGIKFADYGGFNAHYWGRSTNISNISSEQGGHMVSLNLGYNTEIYDIKLGINARISDIYTYDNDEGYDALNTITLGNNAEISSNWDNIYMYANSYMEGLELDTDSYITDINLYPNSRIRDTKFGIRSYIGAIALGNNSDFRQVEIGNSSYIEYMNTDVSSCFKRVKLGIDSYINSISIGTNGYFKHIEMGDQSYMYCNVIGDYAYFQYIGLGIGSSITSINQSSGSSNFEYINVGIDSYISSIQLGVDCSFNHITLGSDSNINNINAGGATNAYIRHIDVKNTSYFGSITMEDSSYIRRMDIGSDVEVGGILLTGGTSISDFQLATTSGIGSIDLLASSSLSNFEIGQDSGFGGMDVTSSMSYVTIGRGFSNLQNTKTFTGVTQTSLTADYSGNASNLPYLNIDVKGVVVLDITNTPAESLNYRLGSGQYEGQELTFVVKNTSGAIYATSTDIRVWCDDLLYPLQYNQTGYVQNCSFAPFAHYDPTFNSGQWVWRTMGKAIWTNGMWVTDSEYYYD